MKLLYCAGGHPLMTADQCLMWERLGIDWFCTAYYTYSNQPGDLPYINVKRDDDLLRLFEKQTRNISDDDRLGKLCGDKNFQWTNQLAPNLFKFTDEFLDKFDAILFDFFIENILANSDTLYGRKVYLRTFGMHNPRNEPKILKARRKGLCKVIRNNPKEHLLVDGLEPKVRFGGLDAMIRGCVVKDENEISGWTGHINKVCTFSSFFDSNDYRSSGRRYWYEQTIKLAKAKDISEVYGIGRTFLSHEKKLEVLRDYRVNLVTGTPGSNNTYSFVEAFVMGQPIVVFGPDLWQSNTYEANELLEHGVTGFVGNSPDECAEYISLLINDYDLAKSMSEKARSRAIEIYGRDVLGNEWRNFFRSEGFSV